MLLAVDVGNTQTVLGLYDGERLTEDWRLATERTRTGDELGVLLGGMLDLDAVDGICLSSTVPTLIREWERLAARWADAPILVVGPGVKTGIPIRYDDPREVGPDRIVNSVAAKERYGAPVIVVDFGTSTNFDVVSPAGEYVGGVLAPGIETSMEALFARAARLVKVDYVEPPSVIGKTTVGGLQSGVVYGFAGQVDGIVTAIRGELGVEAQVDRDGRPVGARRTALEHDLRRRPAPDARRPPPRLGAQRMIVQPQTLAVFALAALAILAVPGPAVVYIVTRSIHQGRGGRARLGARDPRRHARPPDLRRRRPLGDPRLVRDGVHGRQGARRAVPDRDRDPDAARPRRPGGHRPAAAAAPPPPRLRRGRRGQRPQSEDGAVLPRVPAAVRRPGSTAGLAADPRARAHVHAARARHRLDVGARRRLGR